MESFEVHFKSFDIIDAESRDEAVEIFKKKYPHPHVEPTNFHDLNTGNANDVIGFCEDCERPIFEDEPFESNKDGVMWHSRHNNDDVDL